MSQHTQPIGYSLRDNGAKKKKKKKKKNLKEGIQKVEKSCRS
jgi:hypothetical protein